MFKLKVFSRRAENIINISNLIEDQIALLDSSEAFLFNEHAKDCKQHASKALIKAKNLEKTIKGQESAILLIWGLAIGMFLRNSFNPIGSENNLLAAIMTFAGAVLYLDHKSLINKQTEHLNQANLNLFEATKSLQAVVNHSSVPVEDIRLQA